MFGIGLPEMIVILAVALIVVGPDKLPDLARSLAKGMFELKKTLNQVKHSLAEEDDLLDSVKSDLRKTTEDLKGNLIESDHFTWKEKSPYPEEVPPADEDILEGEPASQPEASAGKEDPAAPPGEDRGGQEKAIPESDPAGDRPHKDSSA